MIEPLKPPGQVSHPLPGRSLHEERKRTSDTYVAVSKFKSRLKRRKAERRKAERRQAERRLSERRSTDRRTNTRLTNDRRLLDRRLGERRHLDRRTLDRRAEASMTDNSNLTDTAGRHGGENMRHSIKIDDYA